MSILSPHHGGLCAALLLSCQGQPATAQDRAAGAEDTPAQTEADSAIVVTAGLPDTPGMPAYSTVTIETEAIRSAASGLLEDVLENVAGFQQFRRSDSRSANPSAQGATLRALGGNATSRALVLLDGVPLSDPFFGYIPFNAVDPLTLSHIDVTRGGGAGPFGAGALAGTIRLNSADPTRLPPFAASAFINDRAETEATAMLAPRIGQGHAVVAGRYTRGRGFFTAPLSDRVPASARARFDSWTASARLVQPLGEATEIQLRAVAWQDDRTLRFAGADNTIEGQDVSLRVTRRGEWQLDALAYGQWRNFRNTVISSTRFTRVLDQKDTPASGIGGRLEVRPPVGDGHTLRMGADYRRSEGELAEDSFSAFSGALRENRFAGGTITDLGLYAEHDWQTGDLTLTGGLRADRYTITDGFFRALAADGTGIADDRFADRADWTVIWRAGAVWQADDMLGLRAAAYRGFRLPTLNELYRPFVVFPVVTQANAALKPETLRGFELGADYTPVDALRLSATLFDNRIDGAIANVTLQPNLRQRRNLDAIEARGLELDAAWDGGAFDLLASLALTDAAIEGSGSAGVLEGNRPAQPPILSASVTARYALVDTVSVAATLRHTGQQFEDDLGRDVLPAATTLDLFAQTAILHRLSAVIRVENLLDTAIVTRSQGGSIDLGAPRTVWFGLRWGFD